MNTYFSRFLHHTLSYLGLTRISRWGKFANWVDLDTPIKSECDSLCAGRSMVEMLGVLAIIGVLSVGAISGYSKAMMKYKLNKHAEQVNTLVNAVTRNVHSFDNLKQDYDLTPYLIKMGEIPTEMLKSNDNNFVYDIFGHKWQITISSSMISLSSDLSDSLAICQNLVAIAKENSDNIDAMDLLYVDGRQITIYGDKFCNTIYTSEDPCFKDISLDDIYRSCSEQPSFLFSWFR